MAKVKIMLKHNYIEREIAFRIFFIDSYYNA